MEAPVEVRISGDDIGELKRLGAQVENFLFEVPFPGSFTMTISTIPAWWTSMSTMNWPTGSG